MRQIRIASAKNPLTDFIELNDFNGFLCTQFRTLGISRSVEFLNIGNRNIAVNNKPAFKKYSLTIEILKPYGQYDDLYYTLLDFLDRNKRDGIRLYHRPSEFFREERYCLCSIESTSKAEKRQPIVLNLTQDSLWLGERRTEFTVRSEGIENNLFVFADDGDGYFSASFSLDEKIADYYCVAFFNSITQQAEIAIKGYNEVPLNISIKGRCVDPQILIYRKNDKELVKKFQVFETIDEGHTLEINSGILDNGVWEVDAYGRRDDLTDLVDHSNGSPYIWLTNGEYLVEVQDKDGNAETATIYWNEEYSE
jgi:hypothetical protein